MDTKSQSYSNAYPGILAQLDKYTADLITSLKNAATHAKSVKDRDSWW